MNESLGFISDLGLILICTKVLGLLSRKFRLPQVIGAILGGLLLGPAVLNVISETDFIHDLSKLGVIVLMFGAGMHTDISTFKKTGKPAFFVALIGVLVPLLGGFLLTWLFNRPALLDTSDAGAPLLLQNIFIGVVLTATSVSITVEALKEMGKLNTEVGNVILSAAIIDDVLGIIVLTIVTGFAGENSNILMVLLKMMLYFVLAGVVSIGFNKLFNRYQSFFHHDRRRFTTFAFVYCLFLSYIAERFFGVADITGAFIAGLAISGTMRREYIAKNIEVMSYALLSPMFFASIGLRVSLPSMTAMVLIFAVLLLLVAIVTKIVGCGLAAKCFHFDKHESLQIGVGMMTRGEVALIVANKGATAGLMSNVFFGPIVLMVIVTAIVTPVILKWTFRERADKMAETAKNSPVLPQH